MKSFWQKLPVPFTVLAPMEGVTDVVFRSVILKIGRPDVFFTEFTNVDGIMSRGRKKVGQSLKFFEKEQPVVAQIWGTNPKTFYETAKYCKELGFLGIDINMGCPIDAVIKKGACSALINNHKLATEIINATKMGGGLPVSVKTRIGFKEIIIDEWLGFLLEQNLAAISVHLRTVEEQSKFPSHWEYMPKIIELRNKISPKTLIIGNGDIESYSEIDEKYKLYRNEGFMIGRGIFTNPWMFNKSVNLQNVTSKDRLDLYLRHIELFKKTWDTEKDFGSLKKFSKTYINNFPDSSVLRDRVNLSKSLKEMEEIIANYKTSMRST